MTRHRATQAKKAGVTGAYSRHGQMALAVVAATFAFASACVGGAVAPEAGAPAGNAAGAMVPIPDVTGPIPVDGDSFPANAAARQLAPVDLATFGYEEEEYFLSGSANVYEWDDPFGTAAVRTPNAPYTNRILLRRPVDRRMFSGTLIVEVLNYRRAGGYEGPYVWADSWEYMVDRGHVWVGVTSRPAALQALKTFDAGRYAPLSWDNPLPPDERCSESDTEAGLLWDIYSQVAALLKSDHPSNPLQGYNVEYAYATAQTGGDLALYINAIGPIAKMASGEPVYDGYVIKATGRPGPVNQCRSRPDGADPRAVSRSTEPVIRLFVHSDVILGSPTHSGTTCEYRRPDSDDVLPYRHYEIAGALVSSRHQTLASPVPEDRVPSDDATRSIVVPPNEFPIRYIMNGAFDNLDRWVREGVAPPRAGFLLEATDDCRSLLLDAFGTPLGGVRTPYVDVPANTYPPDERLPAAFDTELLRELYGTHENYVRQVIARTNELIEDRWVTREDGHKIMIEAARSDILKGSS